MEKRKIPDLQGDSYLPTWREENCLVGIGRHSTSYAKCHSSVNISLNYTNTMGLIGENYTVMKKRIKK